MAVRTASRGRRIVMGLIALSLVSVGLLVVAEIGVRILFPHARDHVVPSGLFEIDGEVGWKLSPGGGGRHETRYFDVEYGVNRLGFRDDERGMGRRPGSERILVYGDSEVFGWGLPIGERFTDLVEAGLPKTELWNLAVPGYGFGQQVVAYETRGEALDGDEVVLFASRPTLYRSHFDYLYRKPKPRFALAADGQLRIDPVATDSRSISDGLYRLLSPFHLPYFIDQRLQRLRHWYYGMREPTAPPFDAVIEQILLRAKRVATDRGDRVTVLAHFNDAETTHQVEAFARANGVGFLTISIDDKRQDLVFGPHDQHWNARANRAIADEILDQLRDRTTRATSIGPADR